MAAENAEKFAAVETAHAAKLTALEAERRAALEACSNAAPAKEARASAQCRDMTACRSRAFNEPASRVEQLAAINASSSVGQPAYPAHHPSVYADDTGIAVSDQADDGSDDPLLRLTNNAMTTLGINQWLAPIAVRILAVKRWLGG